MGPLSARESTGHDSEQYLSKHTIARTQNCLLFIFLASSYSPHSRTCKRAEDLMRRNKIPRAPSHGHSHRLTACAGGSDQPKKRGVQQQQKHNTRGPLVNGMDNKPDNLSIHPSVCLPVCPPIYSSITLLSDLGRFSVS
jgi:hypothetical protein